MMNFASSGEGTHSMKIEEPRFLDAVSGTTSRLELWRQILNANDIHTMAEVGVWKGDFAQYILKHCGALSQYYLVDPWANLPDWNKPFNIDAETFDEIYREAVEKTSFASEKITILRGRTKDIIDDIPDHSLDFAYVDGDHTLRGITLDLIKLLPKIKEGGFLGGDDFVNNPWQHDLCFEPTLVCPFAIYFAEAMDLPILALDFSQFLIQKRTDAKFSFIDTTGAYEDISLNKLPRTFTRKIQDKIKSLWGKITPRAS